LLKAKPSGQRKCENHTGRHLEVKVWLEHLGREVILARTGSRSQGLWTLVAKMVHQGGRLGTVLRLLWQSFPNQAFSGTNIFTKSSRSFPE
jgi:hypothetical protein